MMVDWSYHLSFLSLQFLRVDFFNHLFCLWLWWTSLEERWLRWDGRLWDEDKITISSHNLPSYHYLSHNLPSHLPSKIGFGWFNWIVNWFCSPLFRWKEEGGWDDEMIISYLSHKLPSHLIISVLQSTIIISSSHPRLKIC